MAIDTTVAGAASDSYATVAEADSYLALQRGRNISKWTALTTTQKEDTLKLAAVAVDQLRFFDDPSTTTQALEFPRVADYKTVGGVTTYFIQPGVKYGQIETALHMVTSNSSDTAENVTSFSIGSYSESRNGTIGLIPDAAMKWLTPFVSRIGNVFRTTVDSTSII